VSRLVVDASVVAKWLFPEAHSEHALALLDRYQRGEDELLAPETLLAEVANVAWKKCRLLREVTVGEAVEAVRLLVAVSPALVGPDRLLDGALALALTHRRPVYDCLYVTLALEEQCDFVTADDRLAFALQPSLRCVIRLADVVA
jgi:predicted nucleic acid-binding protein